MQNQNIPPIPNDDEWPLATVFDVTAKLVLHHHNDDIFISRRQTSHFNTDECSQTTNLAYSTSTTSATEPHLSDGVNTHWTHQNDNYMQCISL